MQGANLTIQNPQMVNIFLFIMLVYFLYRYWLDTKNNKHHIRNLQAITVSALLTKYIKSRIGDRVNFYIGGFKIANPSKNSKAIILNFKQTNPLVFWKNIDFKNVKISNIDKEIEQKIRGLKNKKFLFIRWKAFFQSIFLESYFTDYLLSYFLASFAIIVTILDYYKNISEDLTSPFINCL
jgi:hypothetical protein